MKQTMERQAAWELLRKYNQDHFHLQHALTVEGVMRWYAQELGYGEDVDFWGCSTTSTLNSTLTSTASRRRSC